MQACRRYLLGRFVYVLVDACGGGSTSRLYRATIILSHHVSSFLPDRPDGENDLELGEDRAGGAWGSQRWRDIWYYGPLDSRLAEFS